MNRLLMPNLLPTHRRSRALVAALIGVPLLACDAAEHPETPLSLVGGDLTVFDRSSNAYGTPAPNLDEAELARHMAGDTTFDAKFVAAPAPIHAGLGPVFNAPSCASCHPRDGRGLPRTGGPPLFSPLLVRVSLAAGEPEAPGGVVPVPGLGTQLRDHAIYGATPEASVQLSWREEAGTYGDGSAFSLRSPVLDIHYPDGRPLDPAVLTSARIPAPVFGVGLLEAIPDASILALADPDDADQDGISGRPNWVWDDATRAKRLGRFGWKANVQDALHQVAGAYAGDMGVSNALHPEADGGSDITRETLDSTTFYVQTLGVPAPDTSRDTRRGERLFTEFGCAGCHVTTPFTTGAHPIAALSHQTVSPYTDLLLHDLGPGLADHRPDWEASGSEWRTPPLWGIGLTQTTLPGAGFLHDGRARDIAEAILWHGGEAEAARERFRKATADDRDALLAFIYSR